MLRRLIGADVHFITEPRQSRVVLNWADPGQVEQIF